MHHISYLFFLFINSPNTCRLAALEIAKFQDQLIKRLNEDALLQLSHEMDGGIVAGGGNGAAIAGNSPATEAVLLHTHGQYGHGHGPHEWNFAKAFLYSLTVLTTIGKFLVAVFNLVA